MHAIAGLYVIPIYVRYICSEETMTVHSLAMSIATIAALSRCSSCACGSPRYGRAAGW